MFKRLGLALVLLLVASCSAGIPEFRYFDEAYDTQAAEADKVLDRLGAAERTLKRRQFNDDPGIRDFDPDEAGYYVDIGDPPLTGAIRNSVRSVGLYNDALSGLATGEAAAALTARIGEASTSLASAAQSFGALSGPGIVFVPAAQTAIRGLLPLFQAAAAAANRAEFRRELIAAYPDLRAFVVAIRAGTPEIFDVMRRSYVQRGLLGGTDGIVDEDLARLEADRQLLAGWVILLDRTLAAMDAAKAAVESGSPADVETLVSASIGIRTLAETISALQSAGWPGTAGRGS